MLNFKYKIIATFEGSKAYYESACSTYLSVDLAATASTPIDTEEPIETTEPATETSIITTELALVIVAVIAAIGVTTYWILKRK